jgi:acetyl esterase/lipase
MNILDRRSLLGTALAGAASFSVTPAAAVDLAEPHAFTRMPLWPNGAPGGEREPLREMETVHGPDVTQGGIIIHVVTPTLSILRPAKPNGAAMLIIPGGGYLRVAVGHEGFAVARRFAEVGYTCFVLLYRLPGDRWKAGAQAPLQDAQRALRLVRSCATREGFAENRIGVIGFSAGGHLAAWLTTRRQESYRPIDAADHLPVKAAVAAFLYPVIMMEGRYAHAESRRQLLGTAPSRPEMRAFSLDRDVAPDSPPAFLAHALDDPTVPYENSLTMLSALRAQRIAAECHLFENGGHGFGLSTPAAAPAAWPDLFTAFARRHGV